MVFLLSNKQHTNINFLTIRNLDMRSSFLHNEMELKEFCVFLCESTFCFSPLYFFGLSLSHLRMDPVIWRRRSTVKILTCTGGSAVCCTSHTYSACEPESPRKPEIQALLWDPPPNRLDSACLRRRPAVRISERLSGDLRQQMHGTHLNSTGPLSRLSWFHSFDFQKI